MDLNLGGKPKPVKVEEKSGFDNSKLYIWVKALESKVDNLLREVDSLKTDFIKRSNSLTKEVKTINEDVLEIKHKHEKTLEKMDLIIKELKKTAGMEEVETLKKYLDLWSPLNFVTQKDLDRAVETKILLIKEDIQKGEKSKIKNDPKNEKHVPFN